MKNLQKIIKTWKTVFSINDLQKILWYKNTQSVRNFVLRWTKNWFFKKCQNWIYCLENVNIFELANKLKTISYVSLETVLKQKGVIFQDYWNTIFSVSNRNLEKESLWYKFLYFKIKDDILLNPLGLENHWTYVIATKERAICDKLYLNKNYYFDNLDFIDKEKLYQISQIYPKYVILEVKKILDGIR